MLQIRGIFIQTTLEIIALDFTSLHSHDFCPKITIDLTLITY